MTLTLIIEFTDGTNHSMKVGVSQAMSLHYEYAVKLAKMRGTSVKRLATVNNP